MAISPETNAHLPPRSGWDPKAYRVHLPELAHGRIELPLADLTDNLHLGIGGENRCPVVAPTGVDLRVLQRTAEQKL
jgi:hypothetical protein